jgi:hypothetical protein
MAKRCHKIAFCSQLSNSCDVEKARALHLVDDWCMSNRGREYDRLRLSSRMWHANLLPVELRTDEKIIYRAGHNGCSPATLCNFIIYRDTKSTEKT